MTHIRLTGVAKQLTRYLFMWVPSSVYESLKFRLILMSDSIIISLHANLRDQVNGDRNSRAMIWF